MVYELNTKLGGGLKEREVTNRVPIAAIFVLNCVRANRDDMVASALNM